MNEQPEIPQPKTEMDHFLSLAVQAVNSHNLAVASKVKIEELERTVSALRKELADTQECYHQVNDLLRRVMQERDELQLELRTAKAAISMLHPSRSGPLNA